MNSYQEIFAKAHKARAKQNQHQEKSTDADSKRDALKKFNKDITLMLDTIGMIEWGRLLWVRRYEILSRHINDNTSLSDTSQFIWTIRHPAKKYRNQHTYFIEYEQYILKIYFNKSGDAVHATAEGNTAFKTDDTSIKGITDILAAAIEHGHDTDKHFVY
ncbi:MAG: hypothetical protein KAI74_00090 [Kiritimatiellae bacterium]|nr:hypothetical protein [Kiritimatiellia bacterium]